MRSTEPLTHATANLAAAHTLLAIATLRRAGEDRALDALLAVEDSILAMPPESRIIVMARAAIAMRRLIVAANDPAAPEWGWLMDALEALDEHFQEACGAIPEPVPIPAHLPPRPRSRAKTQGRRKVRAERRS
jgi:hypothetical protein